MRNFARCIQKGSLVTLAVAVSELCGGQAATWESLLDSHGGLHRIADGRADYVAREAGLSTEQARRFAALVDVVHERAPSAYRRARS